MPLSIMSGLPPPIPLPLFSQEMLQTPNTCILGHAAGKRHAWIPALLLKDRPFLLSKALFGVPESWKLICLSQQAEQGGREGERGQPSARMVADFHTTSVLPPGLPHGGADGLTQVLGQRLIPLGFTWMANQDFRAASDTPCLQRRSLVLSFSSPGGV